MHAVSFPVLGHSVLLLPRPVDTAVSHIISVFPHNTLVETLIGLVHTVIQLGHVLSLPHESYRNRQAPSRQTTAPRTAQSGPSSGVTEWQREERCSTFWTNKGDFCCLQPEGSDTTKNFTQNILQLVIDRIGSVQLSSFYKEDTEIKCS